VFAGWRDCLIKVAPLLSGMNAGSSFEAAFRTSIGRRAKVVVAASAAIPIATTTGPQIMDEGMRGEHGQEHGQEERRQPMGDADHGSGVLVALPRPPRLAPDVNAESIEVRLGRPVLWPGLGLEPHVVPSCHGRVGHLAHEEGLQRDRDVCADEEEVTSLRLQGATDVPPTGTSIVPVDDVVMQVVSEVEARAPKKDRRHAEQKRNDRDQAVRDPQEASHALNCTLPRRRRWPYPEAIGPPGRLGACKLFHLIPE
jgi:hypothetical protein